jgi:hypothetical protein
MMGDVSPATRNTVMRAIRGRKGSRRVGRRARGRTRGGARVRQVRRNKRSVGRPARLVKGSAAAKRYMASIRPKRRRR